MGYSIPGNQHLNELRIRLKHRGVTLRHLALAAGLLVFLWASYFSLNFWRHADLLALPTDAVASPEVAVEHTKPLQPDVPPTKEEWKRRAELVKAAFVHTWKAYEENAWGFDEIRPRSGEGTNNFNGWGVMIVDSLDTMYIMGLHDEFKRAVAFVENATWDVPKGYYAPFFETTIRYLGGLLSAYALSGEPILLERADDLGRLMEPVFDTPSKFPVFAVSTTEHKHQGSEIASIAEMATCQLEYLYLAKATGKQEFFNIANNVNQGLYNAKINHMGGMLPTRWSLGLGQPVDTILSVGGNADSAHEYLLKQYLLTAKTDKKSLEMYIQATTMILTQLLYISPNRQMVYVTDTTSDAFTPSHKFEHLACFLPGLLALGAHTLPLDDPSINLDALSRHFSAASRAGYLKLRPFSLAAVHRWAAAALAQTCYLSYADQPTGLGADEMTMYTPAEPEGRRYQYKGGGEKWVDALVAWHARGSGPPPGAAMGAPVVFSMEDRMARPAPDERLRDYTIQRTAFLLRPETLESLYLMWRTTGEERWRDYGWNIFEAIEKQTKTEFGYSSVGDVQYTPANEMNEEPSYFMAETLKYLYLLFTEEDIIPLDKYVFNTEGHPFPVFEWTEQQRREWGAP
ncbi:hypothetical protein HWV62_11433 [Athelia sp. TMB]|nr:hypothetical protein HWV62_11433 [Athelia sp. TMB]